MFDMKEILFKGWNIIVLNQLLFSLCVLTLYIDMSSFSIPGQFNKLF